MRTEIFFECIKMIMRLLSLREIFVFLSEIFRKILLIPSVCFDVLFTPKTMKYK